MSAPKTNVEKQERRHPAVRIIALCILAVAAGFLIFLFLLADRGETPVDTDDAAALPTGMIDTVADGDASVVPT